MHVVGVRMKIGQLVQHITGSWGNILSYDDFSCSVIVQVLQPQYVTIRCWKFLDIVASVKTETC